MKIEDLNEKGALGTLATAFKGALDPKGANAARRAQSKDPKVAQRGKRDLARAGARRAISPAGIKKKQLKMAGIMLDKWLDQANTHRLEKAIEPTVDDFQEWVDGFMGANKKVTPYDGDLHDKNIEKYLQKVVADNYQVTKPKADDSGEKEVPAQAKAQATNIKAPSGKHKRPFKKVNRTTNRPVESVEKRLDVSYLAMLKEDARIQHAEDVIFWEGSAGAKRVLTALKSMADKQHKDVTLKWDGSPAIVFGRDDSGQFIFTDKGGFVKKGGVGRTTSPEALKNELLMRSGGKFKDDPDRIEFADRMAGLFNIYEKAVPANHRGFFKGDLLYATTPPVKNNHYTFTPNIVTYSVGTETELGKRIGESISGVVIHRELDAEGNESEFKNVDIFEGNDVFIVPTITTVAPVKPDTKLLKRAEDVVNKNAAGLDHMLHEPSLRERQLTDLPKIFYSYINSKVDTGLENLGSDFLQWLETTKLSGKKKENVAAYIDEHKAHYKALWTVVTTIKKAKNGIIEQFDAQGIDVKQSIGDQPGGEGYVLAHPEGDIKLVPRASFSAANRAVRR